MLTCIVCGQDIDATGPAICEYDETQVGGKARSWVPFVEDWRGGRVDLMHPVCFAETHGVGALVAVVHRRDELNRGIVPKLMMENDGLRRQLHDSN